MCVWDVTFSLYEFQKYRAAYFFVYYYLINFNLSQSLGCLGFNSTSWAAGMACWLRITKPRPVYFYMKWNQACTSCIFKVQVFCTPLLIQNAAPWEPGHASGSAPSGFILRKETFLQRKHSLPTLQTAFYILRRTVCFPSETLSQASVFMIRVFVL